AGNVLVSAMDDTDVDTLAGSAVYANAGTGVGASIAATIIEKDTQAFIGQRAVVDALADTSDSLTALGNQVGTNGFSTKTMKGLAVQAASMENVFSAVVAGGIGTRGGALAGAASVGVIESNTLASIGELARINTDRADASAAQTVNVAAANDTRTFVLAGSLGVDQGGSVGIAGGVDVGIIRNDTAAFIGNGAEVHASG